MKKSGLGLLSKRPSPTHLYPFRNHFQVTLGFHNVKLFFAFHMEFDFSKGFGEVKTNVVVRHLPGLFKNVKTDSLLRLVRAVPAGWKFLKTVVNYVDTYCRELTDGHSANHS
jgi:hypothetical protein